MSRKRRRRRYARPSVRGDTITMFGVPKPRYQVRIDRSAPANFEEWQAAKAAREAADIGNADNAKEDS
jgi:hypothetical protein